MDESGTSSAPGGRTPRVVRVGVATLGLVAAAFVGCSSIGGSDADRVVVDGTTASVSALWRSSSEAHRTSAPPLAPGVADGAIPDGSSVSVYDDELPAVANLDPALHDALRRAAADAEDDGVELRVNSGWRSAEHQQQLWEEGLEEHGSPEAAARWVATPETSAHVTGEAVDIGPAEAAAWLSDHGAAHGLCQIYGNEPWHFELRPDAVDEGCPPMYPDPTEDPRMQP